MGAQTQGFGRVFVVGDVDGVEDGDNVDEYGHPRGRVVVASIVVGVAVDGAC